mgnify:FL=1
MRTIDVKNTDKRIDLLVNKFLLEKKTNIKSKHEVEKEIKLNSSGFFFLEHELFIEYLTIIFKTRTYV